LKAGAKKKPRTWTVNVERLSGKQNYRTVMRVGVQSFELASASGDMESLQHCRFIQLMFIRAMAALGAPGPSSARVVPNPEVVLAAKASAQKERLNRMDFRHDSVIDRLVSDPRPRNLGIEAALRGHVRPVDAKPIPEARRSMGAAARYTERVAMFEKDGLGSGITGSGCCTTASLIRSSPPLGTASILSPSSSTS
jgi:hypothetical protein